MAETFPVANFSDMDQYRTVVYDTAKVPEELWHEAQVVHHESLLARIPKEESYRADTLISWDDFQKYRDSRVDSKVLVGNQYNANQIFRRPKFAGVFDRSGQLVSVALTEDNSSASKRTPQPLKPLEAWAEMVISPRLPIPVIGGRRVVHLKEVFTHPDEQAKQENELGQRIVSGASMAAIYYSLDEYYDEQRVADYVAVEDPADSELKDINDLLLMVQTGELDPSSLPGYTGRKVRAQRQVGKLIERIISLPDARKAIARAPLGGMIVERHTVKSDKRAEKAARMVNRRDWYRHEANHGH